MKRIVRGLILACCLAFTTWAVWADYSEILFAEKEAQIYKEFYSDAEQGDAIAQYFIGGVYEHGEVVPQNYKKAADWYRKSAEQGDPNGQYSLGRVYEQGKGVPQSYKEAVYWYRKSAEQGDYFAQFNLGYCYAEGDGVQKSFKLAYVWFSLSIANGYAGLGAEKYRDKAASKLDKTSLAEAQSLAAEYFEKYQPKP